MSPWERDLGGGAGLVRGSGRGVWVRLVGLCGGGIGELVKDHDAAEGRLVEALVVGLDVLVEHGEQAPVELVHLFFRQVQHEAGEGTDRAWSCFAELSLEGPDRGEGEFVVAVVVGLAAVGVTVGR
jgi:hypothetical protein